MKNFIYIAMAIAAPIALVNCTKEKTIVEVQKGNTILSGTETPTATLGSVGDYYLRLPVYDFYGPKTAEGWGTPVSLKGAPAGQSGSKIHSGSGAPDADKGNEGDWYIDTVNKRLYGPKTATGWGARYVSLDPQDPVPTPEVITPADYELSLDGKTLVKWKNKNTKSIDMQSDEILKKVTAIGDYAFEDISVKAVVLPSELKIIGKGAFKNNKLVVLDIPNKVTDVKEFAFLGNELKSVTIANSVVNLEEGAFAENNLTAVNLPANITTIAKNLFSNNELVSITIPNGVITIGSGAFKENNIESLSLPASVKKIEGWAFAVNRLKTILIPEGVTTIGIQAFYNNRLKTVTLPTTLSEIGTLAFSKNSNLETATFLGTTPPTFLLGSKIFEDTAIAQFYVPTASIAAYKTAFPSYQDLITAK